MQKVSFFNFDLNNLEKILQKNNLKKFVAKQLHVWVYKKNILNPTLMSNLSKTNQETISEIFDFSLLEIIQILKDDTNETFKFLLKLSDGNTIESVVMKFDYGFSICVSTQIGCNMGCKFCASGQNKKKRNLQPFEIVLQYYIANQYIQKEFNDKISNIVVMGIGEPFDNFDNLVLALNIFKESFGLEIGARHITVSTCGLVNKILEFAKIMPQVNLAISLHASNDQLRSKLMPINQAYNLNQLINTCKQYLQITNRRLTFEYILLKDINDSKQNALELVDLLKGILCYVNLIPYNETNLNNFKRSVRIYEFFDILNKHKLKATIRLERGLKINAACGQLRINYENKHSAK